MADRDPEILSEEEAGRLWERAAELQAEAAKRIEPREVSNLESVPQGYALTHVRSAALEAGIGTEFVDTALADLRSERALPKAQKSHPLARRFLKNPPHTITVRRVIDATSQDVFSAMEAVFPEEPFRLTLIEKQGDPLRQGILTFDIQGLDTTLPHGFAYAAREIGLRQVFVSLRTIEGSRPSSEMTVHSPITSHNIGLAIGTLAGTLGGAIGFGVGVAGGVGLAALGLASGIVPVIAIGGVVAGGGLGVKGFRALYHYSVHKARKAIEGLVGAVATRAQGGWQGS